MRLVGDLAYLLQNYELAYNMHHTLKRDLQGKDLWIHYAGALVREREREREREGEGEGDYFCS